MVTLLLFTVKDRHQNLGFVMAQVAEEELRDLPHYIESCSMVYIPESGYLLAVPHWDTDLSEEDFRALPNLQYQVPQTCDYTTSRSVAGNLLADLLFHLGQADPFAC